MDALVKWTDGTRNVVRLTDLIPVDKGNAFKKGSKVKMLYNKTFYFGTIILLENSDSDSMSDEDEQALAEFVPLSRLKSNNRDTEADHNPNTSFGNTDIASNVDLNCFGSEPDDSDADPDFTELCELKKCKLVGVQTCCCGLLVCKSHWSKNECDHIVLTDSSDERFIAKSPKKKKKKPQPKFAEKNNIDNTDPMHSTCTSNGCNLEIFAACVRCLELLCFRHFEESDECKNHTDNLEKLETLIEEPREPEDFVTEGSAREFPLEKRYKINRQKERKQRRNTGHGYTQEKSYNLVAPREIKDRCIGRFCEKTKKSCSKFTDEDRQNIFKSYYAMGSLQLQREFIARHIVSGATKRKTTVGDSRRAQSKQYFLTLKNEKEAVCKKFFLNTLSISERTARTAVGKVAETGVLEPEKRGGRQETLAARDADIRKRMTDHINRFPRVEAHYCRANTTREFLHDDLNIKTMFNLYQSEDPNANKGSIGLYRLIFRSLNLSFHHRKKDMCTLCMTYKTGDGDTKDRIKQRYDQHIAEKTKVRAIKERCKAAAIENKTNVCLVFDLQQVIFLPKTNESAVFYKRRLSVYNFTIYDLGTKDCHCFTWNESISKRGSSEIASCIFLMLKEHDKNNVGKKVTLFADGCSGQNKNSILPAMFLYFLFNSSNISEISLRFFEPYHGQNEGDAAHSAIGHAINQAGDLFVPSQLVPIIKLARRAHPYIVHQMETRDFLDFKRLSKELRILTIREDNEKGQPINWPNMVEYAFKKDHPTTVFFKNSHLDETYRSFTLKRDADKNLKMPLDRLNVLPQAITKEKFKDLISLCEGPTPVVRAAEFQNYYRSLPN